MSVQPVNEQPRRFTKALGEAVVNLWGAFPRNIQELIFEKAVICGHHPEKDESLREQLAEFLHDRHPRTAHKGQHDLGTRGFMSDVEMSRDCAAHELNESRKGNQTLQQAKQHAKRAASYKALAEKAPLQGKKLQSEDKRPRK